MEWLAQPAPDAFINPNRPVPLQRRPFIGLAQERRLHRCAPRQGTYLGFVPTPRIHPHLAQRASRDLISASLVSCPTSSRSKTRRESTPCCVANPRQVSNLLRFTPCLAPISQVFQTL